jgi:hypothetical protein
LLLLLKRRSTLSLVKLLAIGSAALAPTSIDESPSPALASPINEAVAIRLPTGKYGDTPAMENIMYTLYKPGKTGTANNMRIEELREIRGIIYAFARESWKERCTTVYSPEEKQKRKTKTDMNKTHESYMKRMKANNNMNITRVMHMTMQERKKLLQRMEHTETNGNKLV